MSNLERAPALTVSEERLAVAIEPMQELITAREVNLGEGTRVRRLLPKATRTTIGAWCFVDHFGPLDVAGGPGMQVPPHPHTGLQTVTWLLEGEVLHNDSLGNTQLIRPGQLNLMTAGRGIAHAEESPADPAPRLHGVQLWIALPSASAQIEPAFVHLSELAVAWSGGMRITVLAGELLGARSPARVFSDLVGAELSVDAGTVTTVPLRADFEYGVMTLEGAALVEGVPIRPGNLLYRGTGREAMELRVTAPARMLLLGGRPYAEPLYMWWNFVGHSATDIADAVADWQQGKRFGAVAGTRAAPLEAPPLPAGRLRPRG